MTFASPMNRTWWHRLTSPQWRWVLILTGGAVVILIAWLGFRKIPTTTFDLTRHSVPLDQLVDGGPGKDGIPAILTPKFVSVTDATFLRDEDRVLGLHAGAEAKAYPITILNWHEQVRLLRRNEIEVTKIRQVPRKFVMGLEQSAVRRSV